MNTIDPIRPLATKWQNQFNRLGIDTSMIDYAQYKLPNGKKCEVFHNVETYSSLYWVEEEVEILQPGHRSLIYTLPEEDKIIWMQYVREFLLDRVIKH